MLHRRVAVSEQIVGFVSPGMDTAPYDLPLPPDRREGWSDAALEQRLGAPVFEHEAVLGTVQALDAPCAVFERCAELVQREGGVQFFQRRGWHRRLAREAGRPAPGSFRSYDTRDLQWWELAEARVALERQLEGKRVRHLCLPSGQGSSRAVCLARDTGHETLLWGLLPGRRSNRPGSDPMYIERLKHDFIFRLPGRRRWSLARLLAEKALRRLRGETGY